MQTADPTANPANSPTCTQTQYNILHSDRDKINKASYLFIFLFFILYL